MQSNTFHTTANVAGALGAITAALHTALEGTAPAAGMVTTPPGARWMIWPELIERESGERGGFYAWWGTIRGELEQPDPEDETLATVLWQGAIVSVELRYYGGIAPAVVKLAQTQDAAGGLYDHLVAQLGQFLPRAAAIDQRASTVDALQITIAKAPGAADLRELTTRLAALPERGSKPWWRLVEQEVKDYWERHGRQSLPVSKLADLISYSRSQIYRETSLGDTSDEI